ncbi:azurin [Gayadomonas joobiniege]|uniref:azurin n=1 Tax=Gayadomonas joobiniege TaxID=1234606 RepID=UPI000360A0C1|nr:azurin [Gayadomonas joobiniege]
MKAYLTAIFLTFVSSASLANEKCQTTIESNDAMSFNKSEIKVPASCDTFTVTLKHTGSLPANVMGHNWVLATKAQAQTVASDGWSEGLDNNYLKNNDERVIAATKIIGGGETTSTQISVAELNKTEDYQFFCSFPGHYAMMQGSLKIVN